MYEIVAEQEGFVSLLPIALSVTIEPQSAQSTEIVSA
jgi:hypothetical protein